MTIATDVQSFSLTLPTTPPSPWAGEDSTDLPKSSPLSGRPIDLARWSGPTATALLFSTFLITNLPNLDAPTAIVPTPTLTQPFRKASIELPKFAALRQEIEGYLDLDDNWDGYNGVAPVPRAVADTIAFLELIPSGSPLPRPMVEGNGEVGLYWKGPNHYAEVAFKGDNRISYYIEVKKGDFQGMASDESDYDQNVMPKKLLDLLSRM